MGAVYSLFSLRWTRSPQFTPLPPNITRKFVSTPSGDLEVLIAISRYQSQSGPSKATSRPPILFVHGGFGHAAVWEPWMTYLSERYEGNLYAISLRAHGASWALSFIRMCMLTGLTELAEDVTAVLKDVEYQEGGRACVLVGHGSGGELCAIHAGQKYVHGSRHGAHSCCSKFRNDGYLLELV
jgi:pimeloyl-ACP methyl ester carboxylesterase